MDKVKKLTEQEKGKEVKEMKSVLIVEDEGIMRESLKDWLEDEGYKVETAEEGEEALQRIGKEQFGIAVLDLRLPGKNGLEVLREAKAQDPKLEGIIITAYPSVETAVEAMKIGAVDYIVKPFTPDALEKSIQAVLGPIQAEMKAQEPKVEAIAAEAVEVEESKIEASVTITKEEIPAHFEQGQAYFREGDYEEALKEFQSILHIYPGHMGSRVWVRKTKEELAGPVVKVPEAGAEVVEAVKVKECIWSRMGVVSYRICTRDYDCLTCEFDQMMQDKIASGETTELDEALERLKELPGPQRVCRYALKGDVSYRLCSRLFQCETCEFGQYMKDALEQKLGKLAARREALRKQEERATS
jgi:DNA-binding response OmpR family regulator